ncbi:hypothetical protein VST7929_00981 [Vibrio stylophorae]|uniref:Uncharacterized protein n=1 Tax=Vibrio stylophorae TaxID=659351 RepID=A0ABN8DTI7_9VIBR|nr:hypothetical protein [Vibrio stylophorae]CAH0533128.1 hypothetical protein VST7929_00981 [Vibrio stylophorae]
MEPLLDWAPEGWRAVPPDSLSYAKASLQHLASAVIVVQRHFYGQAMVYRAIHPMDDHFLLVSCTEMRYRPVEEAQELNCSCLAMAKQALLRLCQEDDAFYLHQVSRQHMAK